MASKQIQCEICFKEYAVGYCKTCGHIGDACVDIHNTGKVFQTHSVIMHEAVNVHEDDRENPKVIIRDVSEERCKQHATERAIFLCTRHDTMICGRCLHSKHLSCGKEVVDLLREVGSIDCEKVNTMKSLLMEVKNEILLLKDDAENSKENFKTNADNCAQECMVLGIKIKQLVDELTNVLIDEITKKHNENESTYSRITRTYNEKITWCENEERKIDQFVHNNMAGYLYLLSRKFDKGVSDVRSNLREIKHKHTFKRFEFKENRVILKCVFEDLEDVCEHQDEVTGSDDGSVNDVFEPTTEIQKTRREFTALSHKAKEYLDKAIKERLTVEAELKRTKADLNRVEKERAIVQTKCTTIKELFNWTQPSGTVQVNRDYEVVHPIMKLIFTFPEGIQTSHHPSPGKSYKGGTFKGYLANNSEGLAVCMALKAEFSTGRMFTVGKNGKIVPNGVSLYDHAVYEYSELVGLTGSKRASYVAYIQKVKAELADKGITEAGTDQMKHLEETVTVDGLALLQAALSS